MKKDYYLILRLTPEATEREIRSAYRRLAIELHPDISGLSSEPFLELQEAYSVLSDPMRRAVYDRKPEEIPIRRTGPVRPARPMPMRRQSAEALSPVRPWDRSHSGWRQTFHPSFSEMVESLWSDFQFTARRKAERSQSLIVDVALSPGEAFLGGRVRILVPVRVLCPSCHGRGYTGPYQCSRCEGDGALMDEYPLTISYPARLQQDYLVRLSLDDLGVEFDLIVQFRPTQPIW
jgi:molecular chaperone DnaJ